MRPLIAIPTIAALSTLGLLCAGVCVLALFVPAGDLVLSSGLVLTSGWAATVCFSLVSDVADSISRR